MNNAINFYDNKEILSAGDILSGSKGSNYEYEMVSAVSNTSGSPTDAIEIIVDLAKSGKVDPWNIDIVKLYDEYMKKLKELELNDNLRFVGRAFVFASILLNLKSKKGLSGISIEDFEAQDDFEDYDDGFSGYDGEQLQLPSSNIISFDEVLQRRTSTKLNRTRGVTLNDLIRHLEFYEQLEKKRALKNKLDQQKRRIQKQYYAKTPEEIIDMTQDEYIKELADKMEQNLVKILETNEMVELTELTLLGFSRASAYITILYLVSYGKFEIYQEELYGELYVKLPSKEFLEGDLSA